MDEGHPLTTRQELAIAAMLSSRSHEEARRRVRAAKGTFYGWLKQPAFQAELARRRTELIETLHENLKDGWVTTQAVEKLRDLMYWGDHAIQLWAAKALLDRGSRVGGS